MDGHMIPKVHHLIRYFIILGLIVFVGFIKHLQPQGFLFLVGPCLFLAYAIKGFVDHNLTALPSSGMVQFFFFLLPLTLIYYGFIGFQLKQLWNERGKLRIAILCVFILFIVYVHITSFKTLSAYLAIPV